MRRSEHRYFFHGSLGLILVAGLFLQPESSWAFGRAKDNTPNAAASVLSAFQGSCGSQGVFTQSANAQTQAIINVIQSIQNTDPCKSVINELSSIQTATTQMQSLQSLPANVTYQTDQQYFQTLTLALQNSAPGSSDIAGLQSAISSLQLQMYQDEAASDVATQTAQNNLWASQSSAMLSWGQQLASTSSSASLAQCLEQSPIAALELGTNLAAYGGSFLPGIYGASVGAIGQLINTGLEVLRQSQYTKAIYEAEGTEMPDALECALESMTDSYCNADDSYALVNLAQRNRVNNYATTPLYMGIDIVGRQLPALLQWLAEIQNEAPPQNGAEATMQNGVYQEISEVEQQNETSVATINNALQQSADATSQSAQSAAIVNAIANLALELVTPVTTVEVEGSISTDTSSPTPFSEYQSNATTWACWLVMGPNANCPAVPSADQNPTGNPQLYQLTDYIGNTMGLNNSATLKLAEQALLPNWNKLVPEVQVLVNSDFSRLIATNAGTILASAQVATQGQPVSPLQVLQNISRFLQGMLSYASTNSQLSTTVSQEAQVVSEAITQLTAPDSQVCPPQAPPGSFHRPTDSPVPEPSPSPIPLTPEQCQTQRLTNIFNLFQLQNGTQTFQADMNNLVDIDLSNRFSSGAMGTNATQILQASGQDLEVALEEDGIGDLDPIADDLDSARSDIEENIQVFRQFFVEAFQQAVAQEGAYAATESPSLGADRPHGQRLGELCMLWVLTSDIPRSDKLTLPNWPDANTQKICESSLYFNENDPMPSASPSPSASEISSSDSSLSQAAFDIGKLTAKIGNLPFEQRVCVFHHYKTENEADTRYGIIPPPPLSQPLPQQPQ